MGLFGGGHSSEKVRGSGRVVEDIPLGSEAAEIANNNRAERRARYESAEQAEKKAFKKRVIAQLNARAKEVESRIGALIRGAMKDGHGGVSFPLVSLDGLSRWHAKFARTGDEYPLAMPMDKVNFEEVFQEAETLQRLIATLKQKGYEVTVDRGRLAVTGDDAADERFTEKRLGSGRGRDEPLHGYQFGIHFPRK